MCIASEPKRVFLSTVLCLSLVTIGVGQTLDDWDLDKDSKISKSEFQQKLSDELGQESNPAANVDGYNEEGFSEATFDRWDVNSDERISPDEWNTSVYFNRDYTFDDDFGVYDLNRDDFISFDEYHDAVTRSNLYDEWDLDDNDLLDDNEIVNGVFTDWDENGDDYIDENEYDEIQRYYLMGN